ncbi:MAG: hypothetical protein A2086_09450 [Spirochaetes bacterium GWD1_27_9]|nr:MAG: hypothetical protein A2Z98_06010 [Spirochaetes bacterium GWB1_27_13]OHD25028.1 MAG: hypothetical protein A2Y34_03110 [Spirochaetes bacterium GWC1_27_15]OHD29720.1 MAG: hypothetical protein A2086_09450 [Spirochaetes bacterium GWD1_27_9]
MKFNIKELFNKQNIKPMMFTIISIILIIAANIPFLYQYCQNFLKETFEFSVTNLTFATSLKILTGTLDFLEGFSDIIEKLFNFFLTINLLIFFQMALLKISELIIVKIIIIVSFVLIFVKPINKIAIKVLIILLFINPGLKFYIVGVEFISKSTKLEMGKSIKKHFEKIDLSLKENKTENNGELQNKSEEKKSLLEKAKDLFFNPQENILNKAKGEILKFSGYMNDLISYLVELTIEYIISVTILFFILPLLYFYSLYIVLKKFFKIEGEFLDFSKKVAKLD